MVGIDLFSSSPKKTTQANFKMFKLFVFACILAFAAAEAKPGLIAAPITTPLAYSAPLAYPSSYVYGSPLAYTSYAPYYNSHISAPYAYAYGSYYY